MCVYRSWIRGVVDRRPLGAGRRRFLMGMVVGLHCVVYVGRSSAQVNVEPKSALESTSTKTSAQKDVQVAALQPPIAIVDAVEYQDGGTTYVHLKDSQGNQLRFCVSEDGFAETIPGNTLFLDASHPDDLEARLPVSEKEIAAVITSLTKAVHSAIPEAKSKQLQRLGDPVETYWYEKYTRPKNEQRSPEEWKMIFAFDALRRLERRKEHAVRSADSEDEPEWYAVYHAERTKRNAEYKRIAEEDARFKGFYPERVRQLFEMAESSEGWPSEDAIEAQGKQLAKAVGNPKILAVATCRAIGILRNSWNSYTTRDQIAIQAMLTVSADDFANALPELADDQTGLLGAGRFFYHFDYESKFDASVWEKWALPITRALLEHGVDDNRSMVVLRLSFSRHPKAGDIVGRIARGQFGVELDPNEQWGDEPGIKATAYLGLATRGDQSVREDVERALRGESTKADRAALELALATLGSPEYLKKEHFELDSYIIGMGALRAIERFDGHHGMDLLMAAGLEHSYAAIANEAIEAAQRITGQVWIPEGSRFQPRKYSDDAKAWWLEHGETFKAERSE